MTQPDKRHRVPGLTPRWVARGDVGLAVGTILLPLVFAACTFEPRGGPDTTPAEEENEALGGAPSAELSEAAALQTIEHFRNSVAAGDLSRALALVDGDATLVDALVGEASEAATRGELLLELRRRHADGVTLEPVASRATLFSGGTAFLVTRLGVFEPGPDGAARMVGQMHETVLLIGSSEGWRIRNLHRSFLPGDLLLDSLRI